MKKSSKYLWLLGLIILLILFFYWLAVNQATAPTNQNYKTTGTAPTKSTVENTLAEPIADALARITKKPFGLKISPKTSPVQPERFSGYHTGTDFETTPEEQKIDVPIFAICEGKLILKKIASGYGGVAVQACVINKQNVTIVYGHLRLTSIIAKLNQTLKAGEQLAVLGTGFSKETDNERKHLHLSIHKGKTITLLGYVQNQSQLNQWLDVSTFLK